MNNELDQEWVELIAQAREYGLSVDEIRDFLQKTGQHEKDLALVSK
ncbi:anti-repressor SinI family protein [Bacillus tianshenii]|nr:anti-repressor SinI family protein [Bacillus tianshenii]MCA1319642.1 anti-repressor SinI family protein [Bacillus tianshenii]